MSRLAVTKIWVSRWESQQEKQALSLLLLSFETECIESEANAIQSEETDETDKEKQTEREQRSRMYSVESLL